jgi:hypothetical protein
MKTTKMQRISAILAVIGGTASVVCGGVMWLGDWGWFYPWIGFAGFVLGTFIVLGGVFIIIGSRVVGGTLAICCGVANFFSGGAGIVQVPFSVLRGLTGLTAAVAFYAVYVLGFALAFFPVVGGVFSIIYRKNRNG